jgi:hypothetical protein
MPDPWYSTQPADKNNRQIAADKFLNATLEKPDEPNSLYQRVLKDRATARTEFENISGIKLPTEVEVICVEKDTTSAANLVVFYLPDKTTPIGTPDLWTKLWRAAWPPY